jgi:hypothetical protein
MGNYAEEITGYDEVDEASIFGGGEEKSFGSGHGGLSSSSGPRKKGKKGLSKGSGFSGGGRQGRSIRCFGFDPRSFIRGASSMLGISVIAVLAAIIIIYLTFFVHMLPKFYGSLAASILIVGLIAYIIGTLLGR